MKHSEESLPLLFFDKVNLKNNGNQLHEWTCALQCALDLRNRWKASLRWEWLNNIILNMLFQQQIFCHSDQLLKMKFLYQLEPRIVIEGKETIPSLGAEFCYLGPGIQSTICDWHNDRSAPWCTRAAASFSVLPYFAFLEVNIEEEESESYNARIHTKNMDRWISPSILLTILGKLILVKARYLYSRCPSFSNSSEHQLLGWGFHEA